MLTKMYVKFLYARTFNNKISGEPHDVKKCGISESPFCIYCTASTKKSAQSITINIEQEIVAYLSGKKEQQYAHLTKSYRGNQ